MPGLDRYEVKNCRRKEVSGFFCRGLQPAGYGRLDVGVSCQPIISSRIASEAICMEINQAASEVLILQGKPIAISTFRIRYRAAMLLSTLLPGSHRLLRQGISAVYQLLEPGLLSLAYALSVALRPRWQPQQFLCR